MTRTRTQLFCLAVALAVAAAFPVLTQDNEMSFFITSAGSGNGANLGGLDGADAHCSMLASAAGSTGKMWRAYLSTQGADGVNARDRIGSGPWFNAKGVQIAGSVDELHYSNAALIKETQLDENGNINAGRTDDVNRHDILTGSQLDGSRFTDGEDHSCSNWTGTGEGSAQVGHHDRTGGGAVPSSWNSAHGSRGCTQANLEATGGGGKFYCFATN